MSFVFNAALQKLMKNNSVNADVRQSLQELADIKFAIDQAAIVAITDQRGRITYVNDKFCEISQYSRDELIGQDHRLLNSGYHSHQFFQIMWATITAGHLWKGEIRNRNKSGENYWVDTTIVPFLNEQGRPFQYLAIRFEITQRKKAEELLQKTLIQLQQTQMQLVHGEKLSSIGQLVSGVVHEINNPVNFIHGNLVHADRYVQDLLKIIHLYQKNYPEPVAEVQEAIEELELDFLQEDLVKIIGSMELGSERIRQIITSLKNFSRVDQSALKLTDIHTGLESTLLLLQHRLKGKQGQLGIEVIKNYGDLPDIQCYPGQLNQVFLNLLSNAIDALEERSEPQHQSTPISRKIVISTQMLNQNWIQIRIADNGIGITSETQAKMFEAFFTTKPLGKGTGLGLSLSHEIITEKHGGKLCCYSTPSVGTELVIEIPIFQAKVNNPSTSSMNLKSLVNSG